MLAIPEELVPCTNVMAQFVSGSPPLKYSGNWPAVATEVPGICILHAVSSAPVVREAIFLQLHSQHMDGNVVSLSLKPKLSSS